MRLILLTILAALLASGDAVSTDAHFNRARTAPNNTPLVVRSLGSGDDVKRMLRTGSNKINDNNDSEERMFATTINGALGKVGSVVETGGAKVIKEAPKLERYQKWLKAGLNPSQVRVDVLKKQPWQKIHVILRRKDVYQYLKFIVDYKRRQPGSTIPKPASTMEKFELWLYAGLTPSQVRVDILKKAPYMKREVLAQDEDLLYQLAKFMVEYKRLNPNAVVAL
ncbi:Secreted RxLR effector peptide protein [Phytophthora palmivora]|uniref:RxLR effector protein n=1 Tax=Phytophthora palmivora TaxID=4796 RepID=A0A2P4X2J1_9STRA|nr:Secreted RxLR effector peptide protein [Phytophthora palmivora]